MVVVFFCRYPKSNWIIFPPVSRVNTSEKKRHRIDHHTRWITIILSPKNCCLKPPKKGRYAQKINILEAEHHP